MRPSWLGLQKLRRRGQRPIGPICLVENDSRRLLLESRSLFAIAPPTDAGAWLHGLDVILIASRTPKHAELAHAIWASEPRYFAIEWEGEPWQTVIDPNGKH